MLDNLSLAIYLPRTIHTNYLHIYIYIYLYCWVLLVCNLKREFIVQ